ncbi:hypothetical protein [Neobacillus terrae]|uniref:hypothetical protein n=1 Tax=Neobacillus terrae TaxID=3034837 RepID=UPI00140BFBCA|nr:hypothetical protein [Neobacillus terrae]NHM33332.1 hypothetical protein [Neobacillus terrae]
MSYFDYKTKTKKDGSSLITVRDIGENALLEFEEKGSDISIIIRWQNEKTAGFKFPKDLFLKVYKDINE